jgi:hypothetical protein
MVYDQNYHNCSTLCIYLFSNLAPKIPKLFQLLKWLYFFRFYCHVVPKTFKIYLYSYLMAFLEGDIFIIY